MRLGDLIDTLAALPATYDVKFDSGSSPGALTSWRGRYEELTLPTKPARPDRQGSRVLVRDVLADARAAVGATFTGYKGGNYVMCRDTPVWADDYGDYDCRGLMGVAVVDGTVVLQTADLSDYA